MRRAYSISSFLMECNLLESFTREDGYSETYTYNANRLLSTIKTSEDLTTTLTWDILYGDGVVISAAQNGKTTNYTYGLERISAISGSTRTEYVYDGRGSVAAEVSYNNAWYTFGGGLARKNVTSKSYTPFGEQIGEATFGFGYNGEYYNAATGMIYLRARFYEPEMNRFGQKDLLRGTPTVRSDTTYSCGLTERKQTPIRVIVYDKTEYDSELGKWVYQGFQNQAVNSPYFDYRDTNNVSMVYVKTAQEFIDAWNASDNVEQLYIYAHSGSGTRSGDGAMIFENQAISFNNDVFPDPDTKIDYTTYINYSYDHLNTINVDRIYLLSCHGAAYDLDHNIAVELAERSGAIVTANTGSVSFTERSGEYYARSGLSLSEWPVLGIWEQISVDESGNAHWSLQEPLSSIGGDIK